MKNSELWLTGRRIGKAEVSEVRFSYRFGQYFVHAQIAFHAEDGFRVEGLTAELQAKTQHGFVLIAPMACDQPHFSVNPAYAFNVKAVLPDHVFEAMERHRPPKEMLLQFRLNVLVPYEDDSEKRWCAEMFVEKRYAVSDWMDELQGVGFHKQFAVIFQAGDAGVGADVRRQLERGSEGLARRDVAETLDACRKVSNMIRQHADYPPTSKLPPPKERSPEERTYAILNALLGFANLGPHGDEIPPELAPTVRDAEACLHMTAVAARWAFGL